MINLQSLRCRLAAALIFTVSLVDNARPQLAITEVMSATRANTNTTLRFRGPDYWELTNFGTNEISLHGYGFRDSRPTRPLTKDPFTNRLIRAGESIIFFWIDEPDQSVTNPPQFRAWWGDSRLPADLQCLSYDAPGFSGWDGDAVWLFDPAGKVVDSVQFSRARSGRAFTYEPETGVFGILSVAGLDRAFASDVADDVGSPGVTTGPVSLRFLQQPANQSADAGGTVSFSVLAAGLPRPHYQWFARSAPISGANNPTLVLSDVQPADAGEYHVCITNGLSALTSAVATLTVNTNPAPPLIVSPPVDTTVFVGQTAVFTVAARGFPGLSYQWTTNGVGVGGATGARLELGNVNEKLSGTRCAVTISNALGITNVSASLTVTRRPDLRFTEIMALPANEEDNRHFDWFELTNFDTNALNLQGWRFSDHPSFERAFTISNDFILQPGESAVFAERLNARLFALWWGADSLPEGLKLCTYSGFGLGYLGEVLYVWNPAATDPYDPVATVSWPAATPGVTLECEYWCESDGFHCLDEATTDSVLGLRGAFRAADGGDIGSPGYVADPPLRILSVSQEAAGEVTLRCRVSAGKRYRLRRASSLSSPTWTPLEVHTATNTALNLTDVVPRTGPMSFYQVEDVP